MGEFDRLDDLDPLSAEVSADLFCLLSVSGEGDLLIFWSDSFEVFKLSVLLFSWLGDAGRLPPSGELDLLLFSTCLGEPDLLLLCFASGDPDLLLLCFASGDPDLLRFASGASGEPDLLLFSSTVSAPSSWFIFSGLLLSFCASSAWVCGSSWALVGV